MIRTVADLITELSDLNPDAAIRLATQPAWAFEYSIAAVTQGRDDDGEPVVWIGERTQLGYLPEDGREAFQS